MKATRNLDDQAPYRRTPSGPTQPPAPDPARRAVATATASRPRRLDAESQSWIERLNPDSPEREAAIQALHGLLLKGARFEVNRRRAAFQHRNGNDHHDLAHQSADDALVAVLSKLDEFRGDSRFTTWAYKFALVEAGAKLRRRAWQEREVPLDPDGWERIADGGSTPQQDVETTELLAAVQEAIEGDLTPRQRKVLVAVTLNDVPIDVLAERMNTTRGALYKTIHDARGKLRVALAARGLSVDRHTETATP
jgi:RNA polymerase sigma-70 factor (ECF subfamily)